MLTLRRMSISLSCAVACAGTSVQPPLVDVPPIVEPPVEVDTGVGEDTGAEIAPAMMAWDETREYATFGEAFELAPAGATIWLRSGEHAGPVRRTGGWPITVRGETGDPADVVLTGTGESYFRLSEIGSNISIHDVSLIVSGASSSGWAEGAAMSLSGWDGQTLVQNCIVRSVGNKVSSLISISDGTNVFISESEIVGGLVGISAGESYRILNVAILDSVLDGNRESDFGPSYIQFRSNYRYAPSSILIEDSEIRGVRSNRGAVEFSGMGINATIRRTRFHDNSSDDGYAPPLWAGAAINMNLGGEVGIPAHADVLIEDSVFEDNLTQVGGAAIHANWRGAWALAGSPSTANITVRRSTFVRNTSLGEPDHSGAIYAVPGTTLTFEDVDFGAGADANTPNDIAVWGWLDTSWGAGFSDVIVVE